MGAYLGIPETKARSFSFDSRVNAACASSCFIFAKLLTASFAAAESVAQLQSRGYVDDYANVLSLHGLYLVQESLVLVRRC